MKTEFTGIIKNIIRVTATNIISLLVSVVTTLLLPKTLGVEHYALWQMYLLYGNYIIYSSLGFCDGIYLTYGGKSYSSVNKSELKTQLLVFYLYEVIISILIGYIGVKLTLGGDTKLCFVMATIQAFIFVVRICGLNFLQAVNEIKKYAKAAVLERVLFLVIILGIFFIGESNYIIIIITDVIAKFVSMLLTLFYMKDIYVAKTLAIKNQIFNIKKITKSGFKLYSSSMAEMILNSGFRFFIVGKWGLIVFGKTSLTFSISNLVGTLLNSVSISLFPVMRNKDERQIKVIYCGMTTVMMYFSALILLLYMPLSFIIENWLPQYKESIAYMAILFPVCIFQTENNLINCTIFKTLNKENLILKINIGFTVFSLLGLAYLVFILNNINLSLLYFVICMAFRCIWGQRKIDDILKCKTQTIGLAQLIFSLFFILLNWAFTPIIGNILYGIFVIILFYIQRKNIKDFINRTKTLL